MFKVKFKHVIKNILVVYFIPTTIYFILTKLNFHKIQNKGYDKKKYINKLLFSVEF